MGMIPDSSLNNIYRVDRFDVLETLRIAPYAPLKEQ